MILITSAFHFGINSSILTRIILPQAPLHHTDPFQKYYTFLGHADSVIE